MWKIKMVILVLLAAFLVWMMLLRCRGYHPHWKKLRNYRYAHRGYHNKPTVPENSLAAFRAAVERGWGAELDVHLMKDGNLAVIHDSSLKRTAGADVCIEDLTKEDLAKYRLEESSEQIPLLQDVLRLFEGNAPLIIELKPEGGNHAALADAVCRMLETYKGVFCIESFDPRCIAWLRKNRPDIIRGFLTENFFHSKSDLPSFLKFALKHCLTNITTVPDFVAYQYCDRKATVSNGLCRGFWKAEGVSWTLKTKEEYDTAVKEGWIPIFEGFEP